VIGHRNFKLNSFVFRIHQCAHHFMIEVTGIAKAAIHLQQQQQKNFGYN
jgi:hypothetical protein